MCTGRRGEKRGEKDTSDRNSGTGGIDHIPSLHRKHSHVDTLRKQYALCMSRDMAQTTGRQCIETFNLSHCIKSVLI